MFENVQSSGKDNIYKMIYGDNDYEFIGVDPVISFEGAKPMNYWIFIDKHSGIFYKFFENDVAKFCSDYNIWSDAYIPLYHISKDLIKIKEKSEEMFKDPKNHKYTTIELVGTITMDRPSILEDRFEKSLKEIYYDNLQIYDNEC